MLRKFTIYGKDKLLKIIFGQSVSITSNYYVHALSSLYDNSRELAMHDILFFHDDSNRAPHPIDFVFDDNTKKIIQNSPAYFKSFGTMNSYATVGWGIKESLDPFAEDCLVFGTYHLTDVNTNEPLPEEDITYSNNRSYDSSSVALLHTGAIQFWIENLYPNIGFSSKVLEYALKTLFCGEYFPFTETYVALLSAPITEEDHLAYIIPEVVGTGYSRIKINSYGSGISPEWSAVDNGKVSNNGSIVWDIISDDWSSVCGIAIVSSSEEGTVIAIDCKYIIPFTPVTGKQIKFDDGTLNISLRDT